MSTKERHENENSETGKARKSNEIAVRGRKRKFQRDMFQF